MINGSVMKVTSIVECSTWSILQYFWPALSNYWSWKPIFGLFESVRLDRFYWHYCKANWNDCFHYFMSKRCMSWWLKRTISVRHFFKVPYNISTDRKLGKEKVIQNNTHWSWVSSADNPCKQFGPRSDLTFCQPCSGSKLFGTLMAFLKKKFEKVKFEKNQQTT